MDEYDFGFICFLPPEIIIYIFKFLLPKELLACRLVCSRWWQIVDDLKKINIWFKHCQRDYPDIWKSASHKSGLPWYDLYISLTLWNKLLQARETHKEFAVTEYPRDEIRNIQVLRNGIVGVHRKKAIEYYDLNTLQKSNRKKQIGKYKNYFENEEFLLLHSQKYFLLLKIKLPYFARRRSARFEDVKFFIVLDNFVYHLTYENQIYSSKIDNGKIITKLIEDTPPNVVSLGSLKGAFHVLTLECMVYTLQDDKLCMVCNLENSESICQDLMKYNFLDQIDWSQYFEFAVTINDNRHEWLNDVITVFNYGKIVFIGSISGKLQIYYSQPVDLNSLKLFKYELLKQYIFVQPTDDADEIISPISRIDIVEEKNSHTVLVALPNKVAVINFYHVFE